MMPSVLLTSLGYDVQSYGLSKAARRQLRWSRRGSSSWLSSDDA